MAEKSPPPAAEDRGFGEFVAGRTVGRADKAAELGIARQQVVRFAQREADRARKPVAAVEGRCRAAQDFDRLDQPEIDIIAAADRLRAEAEAVGHAHAVDRDQSPVAADAADSETVIAGAAGCAQRGAEAGRLALHGDARLEADEVLDIGRRSSAICSSLITVTVTGTSLMLDGKRVALTVIAFLRCAQ